MIEELYKIKTDNQKLNSNQGYKNIPKSKIKK